MYVCSVFICICIESLKWCPAVIHSNAFAINWSEKRSKDYISGLWITFLLKVWNCRFGGAPFPPPPNKKAQKYHMPDIHSASSESKRHLLWDISCPSSHYWLYGLVFCWVDIFHDRRNRRSCKIFASCVNFPGKQRNFSHNLRRPTRFTPNKTDITLKLSQT